MQKYQTQTTENLAVLEWIKAFELSDVHDALVEVSRKVTARVPLLVIDQSTEFDPSSEDLQQIVKIFDKFKGHFTDKVAFVVSKDVHYGVVTTPPPGFSILL